MRSAKHGPSTRAGAVLAKPFSTCSGIGMSQEPRKSPQGEPGHLIAHSSPSQRPFSWRSGYIQDMSTNGTRLNGKRLPRPPYKHPMAAWCGIWLFDGCKQKLVLVGSGPRVETSRMSRRIDPSEVSMIQ